MKKKLIDFVGGLITLLVVVLVLLTVAFIVSPKADPDKATATLEASGYSEVEIGGPALWGCSDDDTFCTRFTAKGPTGVPVSGVVGSGYFKGSTIRLQ
jgi:hypothetical protein